MGKKLIIKGVGSFMAKRPKKDGGKEVITLGTLQDLRIDFNVDIEEIFGGDGLFPIDTLLRSKSIEITATDAKFDLNALQLMLGSQVRDNVTDTLWVLNETATVASGTNGTANVGVVTPKFAGTLASDPEFSVRVVDSGVLLTQVPFASDTEPEEDEFMVNDTTGEVILSSTLVGRDIVMNYKRESLVSVADLLVDEVPFPVTVVHHGSFLQKDGKYRGVETELFACRARGTFTINAQRATASSSQVSLVVIDPERPDGKLGSVKTYEATERV